MNHLLPVYFNPEAMSTIHKLDIGGHLSCDLSVPGSYHDGIVAATVVVCVADVLLRDVGVLNDLREVQRVVYVGALLKHEPGVEKQLPVGEACTTS